MADLALYTAWSRYEYIRILLSYSNGDLGLQQMFSNGILVFCSSDMALLGTSDVLQIYFTCKLRCYCEMAMLANSDVISDMKL